MKPAGSERAQATFPPRGSTHGHDTQPAFSPDGDWLAFTRSAPSADYERAEIGPVRVSKRS